MKYWTVCFLAFLLAGIVHGQKQGNVWFFGDHAGLDFNSGTPTPLPGGQTDFPEPNFWNEGSASICDSTGALLFYTDGTTIWTPAQEVMENGAGLLGHPSSCQSSLIVPLPGSQTLFYVFTTDAVENDFANGLRYSVVDLCENEGAGAVVPATKNTLLLSLASEKLVGIRHANGMDYWILTQTVDTDAYTAFLLSSTGLSAPVVSHVGAVDPIGFGQLAVSTDGAHVAAVHSASDSASVLLMDFNAADGTLSNTRVLSINGCEFGCSFSPDASKLYTTDGCYGGIAQYDLSSGVLAEIIASRTVIIENDLQLFWGLFQTGPDGVLYIARQHEPAEYLSAIYSPNELVPNCAFTDTAVYLGGMHGSLGLPNFVTGYDYSNTIVPCSTTGLEDQDADLPFTFAPNPATDGAVLTITQMDQAPYVLHLYDGSGRVVKTETIRNSRTTLHRSGIPSGIYLMELVGKAGERSRQRVVFE